MDTKKIIGIIMCGLGFAVFFFCLLFIFSVFSVFSGVNFLNSLFSIFLNSKFFPPIGMAIFGIVVLIFSLFSIFWGSKLFPPIGMVMFGITMFIFSLFSVFLGLRFCSYQWLQLYYKIAQILIFGSTLLYLISSIFLFTKFKRLAKRLIFGYSVSLIIYFIPLLIFITPAPLGAGPVMLFSFSPYVIMPLFFIIFFTHPEINAQFKK